MNINKKLQNVIWRDILSVGLDVSSEKIDICLWIDNKNVFSQMKNNTTGIGEFVDQLANLKVSKKISFVIESTGDLHVLCALILTESWFTVKEINPILTKQYINHSIRGTKTDKTDAEILAKMWIVEWDNLQTFNRPKEFIELRKKLSLIASLETQLQSIKASVKNHQKSLKKIWITVSETFWDLQKIVENFELQIKKMQKEIEDYDFQDPNAKNAILIIDSIPGITKYTATVCFASFAHKNFVSKDAMFAFTWFDPKLKQSGQKNIWIRISKRWNNYTRKKLFQSAFCSLMHCELFASIYDWFKARGKHHFISVLWVVKKMIHLIRSMLKNNQNFDINHNVI